MTRSRLCRRAGMLSAVLCILWPAGVGAEVDGVRAEAGLVHDFDRVALHREFTRGTEPRVLKWEDPIRIHIGHGAYVGDADLAFLRRHIRLLSDLSGIEMSYVQQSTESNFRILFVAREDFTRTAVANYDGDPQRVKQVARRANCLTLFEGDGGPMTRVTVIIHVDRARARDMLRRCMAEETTQSMGLVNDAPDIGPSLFNDATYKIVELNAHDRSLLRMLYHPRLRAGMSREEALTIAREILPEVR